MIPEEWRPIDWIDWIDPERYEVSSRGRVRSRAGLAPRILRPAAHPAGHLRVILSQSGKKQMAQVHRLVCQAFNGPPQGARTNVAHNDGVPSNNTPGNLRWATQKENLSDRKRHGTELKGAKHGRAKLSPFKVALIRFLSETGGPAHRHYAAQFGVSAALINKVVRREVWSQ